MAFGSLNPHWFSTNEMQTVVFPYCAALLTGENKIIKDMVHVDAFVSIKVSTGQGQFELGKLTEFRDSSHEALDHFENWYGRNVTRPTVQIRSLNLDTGEHCIHVDYYLKYKERDSRDDLGTFTVNDVATVKTDGKIWELYRDIRPIRVCDVAAIE